MDEAVTKTIQFDSRVHGVETIKRAAYRFIDRCAMNITLNGAAVICEVIFPGNTSMDTVHAIVSDFHKEVLDQDLRQIVAAETASYRNAILALAFSASNLSKNE